MQFVQGTISIRGTTFELNGSKQENEQALAGIRVVLHEAYSQVEVGRSVAEYKVKLDCKVSIDCDGAKINNQNDFLNKFVTEGWLPEDATLAGYIKKLQLAEVQASSPAQNVETPSMPDFVFTVELAKAEGIAKDGTKFKTLKSGELKFGSNNIEQEHALLFLLGQARQDLLDELDCILTYRRYAVQEEEYTDIAKIRVENPDALVMLEHGYGHSSGIGIEQEVNAMQQIAYDLTNAKLNPLVGINKVVRGTVVVGDVVFTVEHNAFYKIKNGTKAQVGSFIEWYADIKQLHKEGEDVVVVPFIENGEVINGFVVEHVDGTTEVAENVVRLKAIIKQRRTAVLQSLDAQLADVREYLTEVVSTMEELDDSIQAELEHREEKVAEEVETTEEVEVETETETEE